MALIKLLLGCTAGAAVLGGAAFWLRDDAASVKAAGAEPGAAFTVRRDAFDVTLTENGTLVAKESVSLNFRIRGEGRIVTLIPEGSEVAQNQVVCTLDTSTFEKEVTEQELELLAGETELNKARLELEIQHTENTALLEKARNTLAKSEKELERYRDGDAPQELRKLRIELKDAETQFVRAKKKYDDSIALLERKYIRQSELEDHKIEYDKMLVTKEGAELAIFLFEKYTRPLTFAEKELAVRDAQRDVGTNEKRSQSMLDQKQVAVTQAEKRVERIKRRIAERREDIANMTLKAPVPGIVIYGDPRNPWNNEQIKVGGTIWQGMTVMTIPDMRELQVKLHVHEADINKLRTGQGAKVAFDTYPGLVLAAEVTEIAAIAGANNPWERQSEVKKFDVEATIKDKPDVKIRPGISAKVEVLIARREGVLFVPLQCVFLADGKHHCHVQRGDAIARVALEVGLSSDQFIEVSSGLSEGEQVLLYNPALPSVAAEPSPDDANAAAAPAKAEAEAPAADARPVEASATRGG